MAHSLSKAEVIDSKAFPGVKYHVRTLNVFKRAKRDAKIMEHRAEYSRLHAKRNADMSRLIPEIAGETMEERGTRFDALPDADRLALNEAYVATELVLQQHINPAIIRAALVKVEGIDGNPFIDEILEDGNDVLIAEILAACTGASGLTGEEAKN